MTRIDRPQGLRLKPVVVRVQYHLIFIKLSIKLTYMPTSQVSLSLLGWKTGTMAVPAVP